MESLKNILQTDIFQEPVRTGEVVERDWFPWLIDSGYPDYLAEVLYLYAQRLYDVGVRLTDLDLMECIEGHSLVLEDAISAVLKKTNIDPELATNCLVFELKKHWQRFDH
ncbi:MAG TPA: hypothetical protein DCE56_38585 [Cyanobacteria bacterium UBA8553]|nr:hypothetical protein [Cyanobacteria bacterium UBA8553]HAJ62083.1 hypothetical protein [Cyanobacteria bacterium UBA8543]